MAMRAVTPPDGAAYLKRRATVFAALAATVLLLAVPFLALARANVAPAVLNKPTNIQCGPVDNVTDRVTVRWKDESTDETDYRIERQVDAGAWAEVGSVAADAHEYTETGLNPATVYTYRVRAHRSSDNTFGAYSDVCRKPSNLDSANFRVYYRTQDCPAVDGNQVCAPDVNNASGQNEMAARVGSILEGSRTAYMDFGFKDLAFFQNAKPLPVDLTWCDGGGCAGADAYGNGRKGGIGLAPVYMGPYDPVAHTGDPSSVLVTMHEAFHQQQYTYGGVNGDPDGNWVYEGQARSIQDKACIGTTAANCISLDSEPGGVANYIGEVKGYLWNTNRSITHLSYGTAFFWTYITEKYGTLSQEPGLGMDLMERFWTAAESQRDDDGIDTLDRALQAMGHTARFRDIFKDFAVANYAKDIVNAPAKYHYTDESQPPGTYGPVHLDLDQTLGTNDQVGPVTADVVAWGARYYQVRPGASVPILNVEFRQDSVNDVYYTLLAVKGDNILKEINYTGRDFVQTLPNNQYDRVVVIVAGLDNYANFRYAFNAAQPVLNVVDPVQGRPAQAGDPNAPEKILIKVEVLSPLGGGKPVAGIGTASFTITIGAAIVPADAHISSAYVQGQYWMLIRAPQQPAAGNYDLSVSYTASLSDREVAAVSYAPLVDADNVVIVDRSGSMADASKLYSAQSAANLYVDSWRDGDMIGVVSYNQAASVDLTLRNLDSTSRQAAKDAISALTAGGSTSIGDSLIKGMNELTTRGATADPWAMVLLSDGMENTAPNISDFMSAYNTRRDNHQAVPHVYTIALGPDADRPRLQKLAGDTGGTYHYASDPEWTPPPIGVLALDSVGGLDLDLGEIYRVVGETVAAQQQIYSARGTIGYLHPMTHTITVDAASKEAIFVADWEGMFRGPLVTLYRPDGTTAAATFTDGSNGYRLWRIAAPPAGEWKLVLDQGDCLEFCAKEHLVEAALKTDLTMEVFLGLAPDQRPAGRPLPILVSLSDNEPIRNATVQAEIEDPSGQAWSLTLYDDGQHGDGIPDDGFYGNVFHQTFAVGSYVATVRAAGQSRWAGAFTRRLRASFDVSPATDSDGDSLPDWWEQENGTDPSVPDQHQDPDQDGLPNGDEYAWGTHPRDADTDDGGESDGSEANRHSDPLNPMDDLIGQPRAMAWPGVGKVWVRFTVRPEYASVDILRASSASGPFLVVAPATAPTGEWVDLTVVNGTEVCYRVVANGSAGQRSAPSEVTCTIPKADPIAPTGWVLINNGLGLTSKFDVQLTLWAEDNPVVEESQGPASPPRDSTAASTGVTQMMISNNGSFSGASWEAYQTQRSWRLLPQNDLGTVFVKYRDAAGNESLPVHATIRISDQATYGTHLPLLLNGVGADLVPLDIVVEPAAGLNPATPVVLTVVLQNHGVRSARAGFWVDLYINPPRAPERAGDIWNVVCRQSPADECLGVLGLAWQVTRELAPGETIKLTSASTDPYLAANQTRWFGRFGQQGDVQLWTYVDSWNGPDVPDGLVPESIEDNNRMGPVMMQVVSASRLDGTTPWDRGLYASIEPRPVPPK